MNLWLNGGRDTERVGINPADVREVVEVERVRPRHGALAKVAVVVMADGCRFECFDGDRTLKGRLGK